MFIVHSKRFGGLLLLVSLLAACETVGPKATVGGLGGAAAGGLIGAKAGKSGEAIAAGVILGALLGGAIGDRLDAADRRQLQQSTYQALETTPAGTSVPWRNPDSGHAGSVTPTRTYQTAQGNYCREYQQRITIGGEKHQAYGTACRQPDGNWKIIK